MDGTKIVGTRLRPSSPAESLAMAARLRRFAKRVTKKPMPRGFFVMGRTWQEAEDRWKQRLLEIDDA